MGFLDERPYRFDEPVGRRLLNELMRVFFVDALVKQFVVAAGMSPAGITWNRSMEDVWPEILGKAANQGKLRALVDRIAEHPEAGAIEVVIQLRAEPPPVAVTSHRSGRSDAYATSLLGGGRRPRPFIDRVELRRHLREFTKKDGERVLVVTGDKRTGKSYSWHLINHIGDQVAGVRASMLDLTKWSGPPLGAQDVMEMVVDAMALVEKPQRDPLADEDSRAWKLRVWFVGLISALAAPRWLVIDGLDRAPLTDAARRLIIEIVEAARNNEAGELRVALLAGPGPGEDGYGGLHDPTGPVPVDDLRKFFDQAAMLSGARRLSDAAFKRLLAELFDGTPPASLCLEQVGPRAARLASDLFPRRDRGHG